MKIKLHCVVEEDAQRAHVGYQVNEPTIVRPESHYQVFCPVKTAALGRPIKLLFFVGGPIYDKDAVQLTRWFIYFFDLLLTKNYLSVNGRKKTSANLEMLSKVEGITQQKALPAKLHLKPTIKTCRGIHFTLILVCIYSVILEMLFGKVIGLLL